MSGRVLALVLGAALASACKSNVGPLMAAGQDCLGCHDGRAAQRWTAAGTFPGRGRTVALTDATGKTITLVTNKVGNFYTAEPLTLPLHVSVDAKAMPIAVSYGGCNRCHGNGDLSAQYGPLMAPNQDCLACHDGAQAKLWTAAGTWPKADATVVIDDSAGKRVTLVTNQVGNFYTAEPLTFPIHPSVDGVAMPVAASYGGCNQCHGNGANTSGTYGPTMAPNQDCLTCHDGAQAKLWTAAGTWPKAGSTVVLADSAGKTVTLTTNSVGNFYTAEPLTFPIHPSVDGVAMPVAASYGGCNQCHANGKDTTGTFGPTMAPNQDCLVCHDGKAATQWTAAGTWTRANATVVIADSAGKSVTLTTNSVGNFYTAEPLTFPLHPSVDGVAMPAAASYGGCNSCHANGANTGVYGPTMAPGQDCLACHDGKTATLWTAAGTWLGPGHTVVITDSAGKSVTLTTNSVGNFYTAEPLTFPIHPSVDGNRMDPDAPYGGCNKCHGSGGGD